MGGLQGDTDTLCERSTGHFDEAVPSYDVPEPFVAVTRDSAMCGGRHDRSGSEREGRLLHSNHVPVEWSWITGRTPESSHQAIQREDRFVSPNDVERVGGDIGIPGREGQRRELYRFRRYHLHACKPGIPGWAGLLTGQSSQSRSGG
jgi:hypothetical protein